MKKHLFLIVLFFFSTGFAKYYSQCKQDQFINENYFKNLKNGVFLDIGSHDGVSLSNTYFFENELGWTGICIEPIPEIFDQLKKNRKCTCIQGCIAEKNSPHEKFLRLSGPTEMLSGLVNKYNPRHLARIKNELITKGGSCQTINVECYNINEILKNHNIKHVNFLSLDTEGGEFEILKSIDFTKCQIDIIAVENNYSDSRFVAYLKEQGFNFVKSLEQDLIFIHKDFKL